MEAILFATPQVIGRSPHGERGLKSIREIGHCHKIRVALLMESVD